MIEIRGESDPISLDLESAIEAEKGAKEFYNGLSERFKDNQTKKMLKVLANIDLSTSTKNLNNSFRWFFM